MKDSMANNLWLCFLTLFSFSLKGYLCLFLKHSSSGGCLRSASSAHLSKSWAKVWYLQLSNDCTAPEAQFRFVHQGLLQQVSSSGCVLPSDGKVSPKEGTKLVVFAAKDVCANKSEQAYTQTDRGSLKHASSKCIQPHTSFGFKPAANAKIEYTAACNKTLQYFVLGSVTCENNRTKDINCPASQVMKITKANYGGYGSIKTCGYNRNYNCLSLSALCHVKRACNGRHNCEINATTGEFKQDSCPGMKKYLYVEYKCVDRNAFRTENMFIKKVRLTSEPGQGFVEVLEDSKPKTWQRLCVEDMKDTEKSVICRTLGYAGIRVLEEENFHVGSGQEIAGNVEMPVLRGNLYCNSQDQNISSCCLEKVDTEESSCSTPVYVSCAICAEPLLSGNHYPAVVFSASSTLFGHSPSQAAMTSDSTWCMRDSPESSDYLKVDLGAAYVIAQLAILGNVSGGNWVTAYEVLYSMDEVDWLPGIANAQNRLIGNSAGDKLSTIIFDTAFQARYIKIFPKSWHGLPCLKVEICGQKLLPDAPRNFSLRRLTAYTTDLTWIKPASSGDGPFTQYRISLFQDGKRISNFTTKSESWQFSELRPYSRYTVTVQAGNNLGYGQTADLTFLTFSKAPTAPPLDIKLSPISSTSIGISWKAPPSFHTNGIITGYEVCFAWVKSQERCDRIIRTTAKSVRLGFLLPATQYKVKVLARNDAGSGRYSKEYLQITNEEAPVCNHSSITSETVIVKLQKPRKEIRFCQVIVLSLPNGDSSPDENLFSANVVTYLDASGSSIPYITAEFETSDFEKYQHFTVGDSTIFLAPNTTRKQAKKYFNGPLTPNTRYTVFQRFLSDTKLLYFSDPLPPVRTNGIIALETAAVAPPANSPQNIKLKVESSSSVNVSWKAPILENDQRIAGYQVCIAQVQSDEECEVVMMTKAPTCIVSGLKTASKYKVRVSAKNRVGYGKYSKVYITITNSAPPLIIPSKITEESFVVKFQPFRREIRFCQIVLITLPNNASIPTSVQHLENYNSYYDAQANALPSYIAAEFDVEDFKKYQEFTVGDGMVSSGVVGMTKYGGSVRKYFNGPLSPNTVYTVFQRFYDEQNLVYISDFLPPMKTKQKEVFDQFKGQQAESKTSEDDFKLPFILLIVLLLICFLILGVVVISRRRMQQINLQQTADVATGGAVSVIAQTEHEDDQEDTPARV